MDAAVTALALVPPSVVNLGMSLISAVQLMSMWTDVAGRQNSTRDQTVRHRYSGHYRPHGYDTTAYRPSEYGTAGYGPSEYGTAGYGYEENTDAVEYDRHGEPYRSQSGALVIIGPEPSVSRRLGPVTQPAEPSVSRRLPAEPSVSRRLGPVTVSWRDQARWQPIIQRSLAAAAPEALAERRLPAPGLP